MTTNQALAFVKMNGVVLESAHGPVPSFAQAVAGEPIRGNWWAHPKRNHIFLLSRFMRDSPEVLVCRLVDGKITYVHRRLWPALVSLAPRFGKKRLAAVKELHTQSGTHKLVITPFPDWVPPAILRKAKDLTHKKAPSELAHLL